MFFVDPGTVIGDISRHEDNRIYFLRRRPRLLDLADEVSFPARFQSASHKM